MEILILLALYVIGLATAWWLAIDAMDEKARAFELYSNQIKINAALHMELRNEQQQCDREREAKYFLLKQLNDLGYEVKPQSKYQLVKISKKNK